MAINYSWSINSFRKRTAGGFTDAVFDVHWTYTGTDENNHFAVINGATSFPTETLTEPFIQYSDLTEQMILGWVQATINSNTLENMQLRITKDITLVSNPPVEVTSTEFPWLT